MPHPWDEQWKVEGTIGKGGQGITQEVSSKEVPSVRGALKYLRNNKDPQARGRMAREVVNLKMLANAGGAVPQVLDHNTEKVEDGVELFVVMDLIPGPTLAAFDWTWFPSLVSRQYRFRITPKSGEGSMRSLPRANSAS